MFQPQWNGRFSLTRASSVASRTAVLASWRLRFALFDTSICLRLAWPRNTLPVPVILKRFATAFFVLRLAIGFGIRSPESKPSGRLGNNNLRPKSRVKNETASIQTRSDFFFSLDLSPQDALNHFAFEAPYQWKSLKQIEYRRVVFYDRKPAFSGNF